MSLWKTLASVRKTRLGSYWKPPSNDVMYSGLRFGFGKPGVVP